MIVEEKTISSEMIYEGAILNLRRDKVTVKDGKTAYREIIEHNGAVALVPVTADGKVGMVKQYRKACDLPRKAGPYIIVNIAVLIMLMLCAAIEAVFVPVSL